MHQQKQHQQQYTAGSSAGALLSAPADLNPPTNDATLSAAIAIAMLAALANRMPLLIISSSNSSSSGTLLDHRMVGSLSAATADAQPTVQ
jgi:hypothetical protein